MNRRQTEQLQAYLDDAIAIENSNQIIQWQVRVAEFLRQTLGIAAVAEFGSLNNSEWEFSNLAKQRGHLEGILANAEDPVVEPTQNASAHSRSAPKTESRNVFVVHGHDNEVKESVARFLERLGLVPIILHEQPNEGRTIIEKFEVSSGDVAFAVVLLTADDTGGVFAEDEELLLGPRARQNVILELGYFMGRLGRSNVCAIHRDNVELPSDFQGVIYVPFDPAGGWRMKLAQELISAKMPVNVETLFK